MRDATVLSPQETQQFAVAAGLTYLEQAPALFAPMRLHPSEQRALVVAGQWRGYPVQRYVTPEWVIVALALPAALPLLQLIPRGPGYDQLPLYGLEFRTGDDLLDSRWRFAAQDLTYAGSILSEPVRAMLRHEAVEGTALVIDGAVMYVWQPVVLSTLADARTHLEVLAGFRDFIDASTWQSFGTALAPVPSAPIPPVPPAPTPAVQPSISFAAPEAPDAGDSLATTGTFMPMGDVEPADNGWIGGDEVDQSHMFYTGPRLKGQARPHV